MKQRGFTLIELMIVVAIIGILASIAIGSYQDYTIRAQTGEALVFADQAKSVIADYYHTYGNFPADGNAAGLSSLSGTYVQSMDINNGVIEVTMGNRASQIVQNKSISLSPLTKEGAIHWVCNSDIQNRFLPSSCR